MTAFNQPHPMGDAQVRRFATGQIDLSDRNSPDFVEFTHLVGRSSESDLQAAFAEAAPLVEPRGMFDRILIGWSEADQFAHFDRSHVAKLARELLGGLLRNRGPEFQLRDILKLVPQLQTADPNLMTPPDVANLADWMRLNDPQAFGYAASQIAEEEPGLLQTLLGPDALRYAATRVAARLAAHD